MVVWQETLPLWAGAWAAVRGQASAPYGSGIRTAPAADGSPPEYIIDWPGTDADRAAETIRQHPGAVLALVAGDSGTALDYAGALGLAAVDQAVLLTAPTDQLNTALELPENAELAQAPLELYDLVEISVFDHPVASGRVRIKDGLAVIGGMATRTPADGKSFEPAVLAALADEAFVHGAETLCTVVGPHQTAEYTAAGWTVAAHIISLTAAG